MYLIIIIIIIITTTTIVIGVHQTSVSETIRKRPLVKAQTALRKQKKNKIWRKTIFNMADGILTPCNVARGSGIMTVWIHQVAVSLPCNVKRGSGMTCHWIRQVAAPCNVAGGSGITWHWIRPNVRHIGILLLVSILTISPQSTCHSTPVCEILSKSDHPRQKKIIFHHLGF